MIPSQVTPTAPIPINTNAKPRATVSFVVSGIGVKVAVSVRVGPRVPVRLAVRLGRGVKLANKKDVGVGVIVLVGVFELVGVRVWSIKDNSVAVFSAGCKVFVDVGTGV